MIVVHPVRGLPSLSVRGLRAIRSPHPIYHSAMRELESWQKYPNNKFVAIKRNPAGAPDAFLMFEKYEGGVNPFNGDIIFGSQVLYCYLYSKEKGKGHCSRLMHEMDHIVPAMFHNLEYISLIPSDDTIGFYRKHGFKLSGRGSRKYMYKFFNGI